MAFKMAPVDKLTVDVEIEVPVSDGEPEQKQTMRVTFKKHPRSVIKQRREMWSSEKDGNALTDDEILEQDVIDIDGLQDPDGNPVPYSVDILRTLLEMDYVHVGLMRAWSSINYGDDVMRFLQTKNA